MKTPLGIIRGFSENLMENTVPAKKEYYLKQIVYETDNIKHLIEEMADMSGLDSENPVLKYEDISVGDVIKTELIKLKPVITERGLTVQLHERSVFYVTADRKYLSKAIFNLLDNAVRYSDASKNIDISIDKRECMIENSCLHHPFDTFDHSNPGSGRQQSPSGMGLYLTRRSRRSLLVILAAKAGK